MKESVVLTIKAVGISQTLEEISVAVENLEAGGALIIKRRRDTAHVPAGTATMTEGKGQLLTNDTEREMRHAPLHGPCPVGGPPSRRTTAMIRPGGP